MFLQNWGAASSISGQSETSFTGHGRASEPHLLGHNAFHLLAREQPTILNGEVLAGPYRIGAVKVADEAKRLLRSVVSEVIPFTLETADHYARIRGSMGLPPADSIHLASAAQAGTDLFITNDKNLIGKLVPGIQFIAPLDTQLL